jgi:dipeptidyl aminopeptidase/acylaminoacyl peptidase
VYGVTHTEYAIFLYLSQSQIDQIRAIIDAFKQAWSRKMAPPQFPGGNMNHTPKRPLTAEDLYLIELVTDPQISPDGRSVIFGVLRVDRKTEKKYTNLWLVATDGQTPPRQFTYGDQTDTLARWSPDGQSIAFLSNRKDEKQMQLYIIPLGGGEARPVTQASGSFASYEWSPNGRSIVAQFRKKDAETIEREKDEQKRNLGVVARHITNLNYKFDGAGYLPPENWHIWTFDTSTGDGVQLTDGEFHETEPTWSPDGAHILFVSNRLPDWELNPDGTELYTIPAAGGEMTQLPTDYVGRKFNPAYSRDGRFIAYKGRRQPGAWAQNSHLFVVPAAGGESRCISAQTDLHLSLATLADTGSNTPEPLPIWSADGRLLYTLATDKANQPLLAYDVQTGDCQRILDEPGLIGTISFSANQSRAAYLWGAVDSVGQVWVRQSDGSTQALTQFNAELFDQIEWGTLEEVWITSADGTPLQGWILQPPGFDPAQTYPSILEIHGGPMTQYGRAFMHEFHFLAANGYVVYFSNPRGSQGYGQGFATAIANQWGTVDYDDVMAWTDYVAQQPYIDTTRMGVTGGSYGGYMTTLIIGKTHRFQAAVAQRVVSNFLSFYGSSDLNTGTEGLVGTDQQPWTDFEGYWKQSPISLIGNAQTPTLIIHSERDYRCNQEQGEQVYVALKRLGVPTEMVLFPEESHGLSRAGRTDRRIQRLTHMVRWFDTYLKV